MSDRQQTPLVDSGRSRQWRSVALTGLLIIAVVLATGLTPALGSLANDTPASSVVPVPGGGSEPLQGSGGGGSAGNGTGGGAAAGGGSQLGALSPGQETSVGGSLASENSSGFQSQNDEIHFVVNADRPAYWRTNAYDRYTGSGWQQTGTPSAYSAPIHTERSDRQLTYSVQLKTAATALPTAWRPHRVRSGATLQVTPTRAVHAAETLPAGTTYTARSSRPPRDPAVLKATSGSASGDVADKYTQLPREEREALTPAVETITAGATSRYAAAKRVEAWLETNKNYSLSVSEPPSDGVASQFVHDMEAGYCEYFATSMTALLRAHDIPARYVVGYAPGEQSGPNQYTVRALHAHAWVEVYFSDVGWVRFDPTPASERQTQEAQSIGTGSGSAAGSQSEYTPAGVPGSPGETPPTNNQQSPNGTQSGSATGGSGQPQPGPAGTTAGPAGAPSDGSPTSSTGQNSSTSSGEPSSGDGDSQSNEPTQNDSETGSESSPLNVTLNRDPVPGSTVLVTVTRQDTAVSGARVSFNGESVGVTNETGNVTGTVPYTATLNISVTAPTDSATAQRTSQLATPQQSYRPLTLRSAQPARDERIAPRSSTQTHAQPPESGNNTTKSYSLATNASVSILGRTVTGNTVRVVAAVDNVSLRNASVSLDGEAVARTNNSGMTTLTLPSVPGNATIRVERGEVAGTRSVRLPELTVNASSVAPLALPFTRVEVMATLNGSAVPGAPVRLNGNEVGVTGPDGTLTTRLPVADAAALEVRKFEQTTTTSIQGIYQNTAIAVGAVVLVVGVLGYTKRRSGVRARGVLARLTAFLVGAVRWLSNTLVYVATTMAGWVARSIRTLHAALRAVLATLRGKLSPRVLATRLARWLQRVRRRLTSQTSSIADDITNRARAVQRGDTATPQSDYRTFREAWETLLTHVSIRRPDNYTPGELAAHAVSRDELPADAVATLRNEFRAVEYGHREPSARLERVETASQAIEAAARDEATQAEDSSETGGAD
ncbi:transglutaminaseTgpA domain-containing protein [Halobacterium noricense]|uniref:transglutaminaseTgpA domain-containing protein n=1 Tax=Halobacterium noricense TaxID=223182 RepID=UPI001E365621|nr:transglutaminaseTgpA domain-containing protein [Halobacterium noricense]UHH26656.1 transglutaminaseTgpA domain-containing protein [Halobacterium noricense]